MRKTFPGIVRGVVIPNPANTRKREFFILQFKFAGKETIQKSKNKSICVQIFRSSPHVIPVVAETTERARNTHVTLVAVRILSKLHSCIHFRFFPKNQEKSVDFRVNSSSIDFQRSNF